MSIYQTNYSNLHSVTDGITYFKYLHVFKTKVAIYMGLLAMLTNLAGYI